MVVAVEMEKTMVEKKWVSFGFSFILLCLFDATFFIQFCVEGEDGRWRCYVEVKSINGDAMLKIVPLVPSTLHIFFTVGFSPFV
ncbi:hypothetical protein L6452_08266 [Arctium lappa]|uniref:Uncharacterized protein n=1 Tax=Arctium lappa TaxID=4217 RepID=A0ACB9DHE5_ARCLA|nr:hypothetical protein L6452_08266 [Arctium lappa]